MSFTDNSSSNKKQFLNLIDEDWRYLIVFDACRYDFFEKIFKKYFKGTLKEKKGNATWTLEWLEKNFKGFYTDIAYVSSTTFCNPNIAFEMTGSCFSAKDHFIKIYYALKSAEDEELAVVHPKQVNSIARKAIIRHPDWRFIIHFFQPHLPGIEDEKKYRNVLTKNYEIKKSLIKLPKSFKAFLVKIFGNSFLWKFKKFFCTVPFSYEEIIWREKGSEGYISTYWENLHLVMEYTKELINHLPPGKVVITSDHGELLGERNFFGHGPLFPRLPGLIKIPWLEIER